MCCYPGLCHVASVAETRALSGDDKTPPGARSGAHTAPFTRNFKGSNASCKPWARSPHLSTASLHGKGCLQKRFETEAGGSEALPEATASSPSRPPSLLPLLLALPQVDKQSYKITSYSKPQNKKRDRISPSKNQSLLKTSLV